MLASFWLCSCTFCSIVALSMQVVVARNSRRCYLCWRFWLVLVRDGYFINGPEKRLLKREDRFERLPYNMCSRGAGAMNCILCLLFSLCHRVIMCTIPVVDFLYIPPYCIC